MVQKIFKDEKRSCGEDRLQSLVQVLFYLLNSVVEQRFTSTLWLFINSPIWDFLSVIPAFLS